MPAIYTIGISAGDPAGIGLEVTLKVLPSVFGSARWVLFTDPPAFEPGYNRFGRQLPFRWIKHIDDVSGEPVLFLMEAPGATGPIPWGAVHAEAGKRALAYLEIASRMALGGKIDAIVTAPVSKVSIGPGFTGQTEFLAAHAGAAEFAMAFFTPTFKVVLATVHVSLKDALTQISTGQYVRLVVFVNRELHRLGFPNCNIAISAINPHAGESGMFGREDMEILRPAVERCAQMGIRVTGPHSADSLYYRAHRGEFDVVIAPYHDQGLIPVKLIAHGESVNVTLGLPYVRTSPDHGTAFSIAGQDVADYSGMASAMRCALDLVQRAFPQSPQIP